METAATPTRKSLPMTARDLQELARLRDSTAHREALSDLLGAPLAERASEAAVLHAVWEAGLKAVLERVEAEGYAVMATERDASTRRAVARRRRPGWADEP